MQQDSKVIHGILQFLNWYLGLFSRFSFFFFFFINYFNETTAILSCRLLTAIAAYRERNVGLNEKNDDTYLRLAFLLLYIP